MTTTERYPSPVPRDPDNSQEPETEQRDTQHTDEPGDTGNDVDAADAATPESDDQPEGADETAANAPPRRTPRPRTVVLAVVIAVLLCAAGFCGYQWYHHEQLAGARADAAAAAREYALDLATYDYKTIKKNFHTVTANSTDSFAEQYKQVSSKLAKMLKKYHAVSKANIVRSGVASSTMTRAVVILFIDQTITNTNSPKSRTDRNRMEVTVVKHSGKWLLDQVKLL